MIEAEQDAAALSVSFLVVQSCRFAFSGELADELSPGHQHKQQVIEECPAILMMSKCRSFLFSMKSQIFFFCCLFLFQNMIMASKSAVQSRSQLPFSFLICRIPFGRIFLLKPIWSHPGLPVSPWFSHS